MEIENKVVLITGASRGIGRAFAETCAESKCHLHLAMRSVPEGLESSLLRKGALSVKIWNADLSTMEGLQNFVQQTKDLSIDILFNNAGQLTGGLFEDQKMEDVHRMLFVNVNALIHLTHAFLPRMLKRKMGKIINHSSVSAIMHFPCATTYAASKAAVYAFTNCLRQELKGTGVSTLTLITPGVKTEMFDDIEDLYGGHLKLNLPSVPSGQYADMIKEAVLHDLTELIPSGITGVNLRVAQHAPKIFEKAVRRLFTREPASKS